MVIQLQNECICEQLKTFRKSKHLRKVKNGNYNIWKLMLVLKY